MNKNGSTPEGTPIVFAYWKDNKFKGFRVDTFNTIGEYPKIYGYSPSQVETVISNIKDGCNNVGTKLGKVLTGTSDNDLVQHLSTTEKTFRNWQEFEVRVHPFIGREEDFSYPEKWKLDAEISNLKPAIETYKIKILDYEN